MKPTFEPKLNYVDLVWGERLSKRTTEEALAKMCGLVLRATSGALLGIGYSQNSTSVQATKAHYGIKRKHGVNL